MIMQSNAYYCNEGNSMTTPDSTPPPANPPREPDAPQRARDRPRRTQPPPSGGVAHFAAFTIAPTLELEVHVAGATGVGSDGRAAGGSRWDVSGWQLIERRSGKALVLAGQRGSYSAMWTALELAQRTPNADLAASLSAAGVPRIIEAADHA